MNDKQSRATTPSPLPPEPCQVCFAQAKNRLRFFARLDQFNRAIQRTNDLEQMLQPVNKSKSCATNKNGNSMRRWKIRRSKGFFQG